MSVSDMLILASQNKFADPVIAPADPLVNRTDPVANPDKLTGDVVEIEPLTVRSPLEIMPLRATNSFAISFPYPRLC
jgi:hypothetical protein